MSRTTRYIVATVIGIACAIASYKGLIWIFSQIGVHAHEFLPYPVTHNIGRYDVGDYDWDLTNAGFAIMTLSIVIGANVGAAAFYKTRNPWKTVSEKATAKACWFISIFMLFSLSVFQLLSRRFSDGIPGFIVSVLEAVITIYAVWKTWQWWKRESKSDVESARTNIGV